MNDFIISIGFGIIGDEHVSQIKINMQIWKKTIIFVTLPPTSAFGVNISFKTSVFTKNPLSEGYKL